MIAPLLDGRCGHLEQGSDLGEGQQPAVAQTPVAGLQTIASAQGGHAPGMERFAGTGASAAPVEDGGDLPLGVTVEQFIDLGDRLGSGLAALVGGQFGPDRQLARVCKKSCVLSRLS